MRIILLALVTLSACAPRLSTDFIDAEEYDRSINGYRDLVGNTMVYSVQLGIRSDERLQYGSRFTMKLDLIKKTEEGLSEYPVRFVSRSSPEEWPIDDVAYLLIDDRRIALDLIHVNPRNTHKISGSAMDGNVSISTSELQVFRIASRIPVAELDLIKPSSKMVFVFRSGDYPVTFRLTESDVSKVLALRSAGVS